jgi:DNA repair exonuclease SbcCD nuclease subunit
VARKPADFLQKFERPYKALLDAGVRFYASLGNHDDPAVDISYPPFDMNGQRYTPTHGSTCAFS